MPTPLLADATASAGEPPTTPWHALTPAATAAVLGVDPERGLDDAEAAARRGEHGPNRLAEGRRRPAWLVFVDQFRNVLVLVLMGAGVLAGLVGDLKDTVVIGVVLVFNAILGFVQEHRAERSLAALEQMLVARARVLRGGTVTEVDAVDVVPGDIVLVEAGDRVPADGRLVAAHAVEVDESTLTGESVSVAKALGPVDGGAPLAERSGMAFMNTVVTRGRAEIAVTTTGMDTEIGRLADLLQSVPERRTPLQEQLHGLGKRLAAVAAVAVSAFVGLGLASGASVADTVLSAVALAVAAIPEGLPAVVTVTLAVGVHQMAKRGAIVKRLSSVETLGATTVICSDKTGTLTLNEMTARIVVVDGQRLAVSGEGYADVGTISPAESAPAGGAPASGPDLSALLDAAVLCNDSTVTDGRLLGDPTEGALVTLAAKAGVDADRRRKELPRVAEVPFDSARKLMATFHRDGESLIGFVKGAPDVLIERCALSGEGAAAVRRDLDELAGDGLRVLALATIELPAATAVERHGEDELLGLLDGLRLLGLVGLLDPPRPEARTAIALCHRAGIDVKMITGDHASTATAIARRLGITGATLTGTDLDRLDDRALADAVGTTGVFARVAPEHKLRLVQALRDQGHVVAMTGDGVNDAPALQGADIGVAMGITGTEVSKEAADMVLTDDDFATIVKAVESGRTIYDNILKFVRFQLSTNLGAILSMLGAQLVGLPSPFTALQVLWVNLIMDGPPAMALGVDPPADGVMCRRPRPVGARILTARRLGRLLGHGAVMAAGTLGVLAWQRHAGTEDHALTMAFTTFVMFQVFNAFNARDEHRSAFTRASLRNAKLWASLIAVVALQALAVHAGPVQAVFDTTGLRPSEWLLVVAVASSVLWLDELRKLLARRAGRDR